MPPLDQAPRRLRYMRKNSSPAMRASLPSFLWYAPYFRFRITKSPFVLNCSKVCLFGMGRAGEGNSVYGGLPSSGRAGRFPAARRY